MLRFARTVDDATHHGHVHAFHARIGLFPFRHLVAQEGLDIVCQLLEHGRRRAAATRARNDHRRELAQAHRLQDFLADDDFARAIAARLRRQRNTDRVADALLQQHRQRGGRGDDALAAHARFGQAQVQRVIAAARQFAVHGDQVLHARDLARQDDLVARQAHFFGADGVFDGRRDQRFIHDGLRRPWIGAQGVLVHDARQQRLVQAAPVHADAHRLVVLGGDLDHLGELGVALGALPHIARIDAVFRQRLRALGIVAQQQVAVVVEVADQRHIDFHAVELGADRRYGRCCFRRVHGDAHDLGAGTRQLLDLDRGADRIGGIGIGHRLDDDGCIAADPHLARAVRDQDLAAGAAGHRARRNGGGRCELGDWGFVQGIHVGSSE